MASYLDCITMMHKIIASIILLLISISICSAQNDNTKYADTSFNSVEKVETITSDSVISTVTVNSANEISSSKEYQINEVKADTLLYDNSFRLRKDSVYKWRNSSKYLWVKTIEKQLKDAQAKKDSLDKKQQNKKYNNNSLSFLDKFFSSNILTFFLLLIAACVVIYIIYKLFLSKGIFGKASKKQTVIVENEIEEDNMDRDFNMLFKKYYAEENIRMAMRYLFLKMLKALNDKNIIQFAADKTNSQYARELPTLMRNEFTSLALYYEYIWYGKVEVSKNSFDEIVNKFNNFLNRV